MNLREEGRKTVKKIIMLFIVGFIFTGYNIFAANGDLIVNGKLGVGTTGPAGKLEVQGGRSFFSAAGEQYGIGIKYNSSGGAVYFGATSGSATPDAAISNAGGFTLMTLQNSGNVGIGTMNPQARFHVSGVSIFDQPNGAIRILKVAATPGNDDLGIWYVGEDSFALASWGAQQGVRINTVNGSLGVGITPGYKLDVGGDIMVRNGIIRSGLRSNFFLALQGDRNLVLYDNGVAVWQSNTYTSDIRLKKNISQMTDVLPQVMQMSGIRFNWIDESWGKQAEIGVIAQEVEKFFPEIVTTDQKSGYKLVQYEKLTPILIEAVKELKAENDSLKDKLERFEKKIESIEQRLDRK